MAVATTRMELDAAGLRRAAGRSRDADAARRMLASALVLDGRNRTKAAALCGMDRQTLRDWVHRYNEFGLDGLSSRIPVGPRPRLTLAQEAEVAAMVRAGPSLADHGVVRWRRVDLSRVIKTRFGVHLAERSVGDMLRRLGFRRLSHGRVMLVTMPIPRKRIKNFADLVAAAIPEHARGKPIELWWQDEARGGQQGTLTRLWAECGSRPAAPRDCRYAWAYLFGAVCPARGIGAALVLPYVNANAMNLHLAEISRHVAQGAHAVITIDGAGWHQPESLLKVPDNINLLPLPPYSPQLNPQENVWQYLRQNYLSNRVFDTCETIVDACCHAWNSLAAQPDRIMSITSRDWVQQVTI